jgi:putative chitinase
MTINRTFFFDHVRTHLFTGKLTPAQVNGLNFILDEWEAHHKTKDDRWLAYALATAFHETAFTMQPIKEYGGVTWYTRMYDPMSPLPARVALAKKMGNTVPGDGARYCGKGYVQLTWRNNYRALGNALGVDLEGNPDLGMKADIASQIMFYGMERGSFTGRKFADYFSGALADWKNARRIINGLDCADKIAIYGKAFYAAISYTV